MLWFQFIKHLTDKFVLEWNRKIMQLVVKLLDLNRLALKTKTEAEWLLSHHTTHVQASSHFTHCQNNVNQLQIKRS